MSHTWFASQRYRLPPAPGSLGLVQDFLNTVGIGDYGPDLLADPELGRDWAAQAGETWLAEHGIEARPPVLSGADVAKLHGVRETIAKVVAGESVRVGGDAVLASFAVSESGEVRLEPGGGGWRWYAAALWTEILLSQ